MSPERPAPEAGDGRRSSAGDPSLPGASSAAAHRLALAVCLVATIGLWILYALRMPLIQDLPGWFWHFTNRPTPHAFLVLPLLLLTVLLVLVTRRRGLAPGLVLSALLAGGFALQIGFALMEGRGIQAIRSRMVRSGHAAFARQAVKSEPSASEVLTNYVQLVQDGSLSRYPHGTKPPGQLLTYIGLERLSRVVPALRGMRPFERLTLFSSYFLPALTYAALLPLFGLSRILLDRERAYVPLLLFLFIPSVTLITLHLDQCLYPLLFLTPISFLVASIERNRPGLAAAVGPLVYLALFVSFSMVAILPVLAGYCLLALLRRRLSPSDSSAQPVAGILQAAALSVAGLVATHCLALGAIHYDAIECFRLVMENHSGWKIRNWTAGTMAYTAFLDLLEFCLWIGIPVSTLAALQVLGAGRRLLARRWLAVDALSISTACSLVLLAFLGKTVAETARLWLFLVPLCVLFAGVEAPPRVEWKRPVGLFGLLLLQLITTLVFKRFQDFY